MRDIFYLVRGALVVGALLLVAMLAAPEPTTREAHMWCEGVKGQRFDSMQACWKVKANPGCGCSTSPNPAFRQFWNFVPLALGVAGFLAFLARPWPGAFAVPVAVMATATIWLVTSNAVGRIDNVQTLNDFIGSVVLAVLATAVYGCLVVLRFGIRRATSAV